MIPLLVMTDSNKLTSVQRFVQYVLMVLEQDDLFHFHLNHIQLKYDQHLNNQKGYSFNMLFDGKNS